MKIAILGTGCAKCNMLEAATRKAADALGVPYELEHIKDINKIASYGVMFTPALVVDGQVKVSGKVPSDAEITAILTSAKAG